MNEPRILQNAIRVISEDKIYVSKYGHDFVQFTTSNGAEGFIDGGRNYLRCGGCAFEPNDDIEQLYLTEKDCMTQRINKAVWGTYGKEGKGPLRHIKLKDATTDHLVAILTTQHHISGTWIDKVIRQILKERAYAEKVAGTATETIG